MIEESAKATQQALETVEVLVHIFSYYSQRDIARSLRVCSLWQTVLNTTTSLLRKRFLPPCSISHCDVSSPIVNTYVIDRLRWSPTLELSDLNSPNLFGHHEPQSYLQMMTYEKASWRQQLLTFPPLNDIIVIRGDFYDIEFTVPHLRLTFFETQEEKDQAQENAEVTFRNVDGDDSDDSEPLEEDIREDAMTLEVQNLPHNDKTTPKGIKVIDLLYGLRQHYLDNDDRLVNYDPSTFEEENSGRLVVKIISEYPTPVIDVRFR